MGKVQILAVLTMDGCHSSELYGKAYEDLRLDRCDIDKIRENALYHITPDYSISMLDEWRKDNTNICYLAEATTDNSDYINGLLRMRVVDEIILYTVPFISERGGTSSGRHCPKHIGRSHHRKAIPTECAEVYTHVWIP